MTKEEIKEYLQKNNASEQLLKMPAVMERIYALFNVENNNYSIVTGNLHEIETGIEKAINIDSKGNIFIKEGENQRSFIQTQNGEVKYINNDTTGFSVDRTGEYTIDQYGMDSQYRKDENTTIKRKGNRTIEINGNIIEDNGSPILSQYELTKSNKPSKWRENKEQIIREYEITREWYQKRENNSKENPKNKQQNEQQNEQQSEHEGQEIYKLKKEIELLEEQNRKLRKSTVSKEMFEKLRKEKRKNEVERSILRSLQEELKKRISALEQQADKERKQKEMLARENARQKQENQELRRKNQNLQRMLKQTLDFCEKVRNSFLGRFFFGSKLKQLPSGKPNEQQPQQINTNQRNYNQTR